MTRGRRGSLLLRRRALPSPPPSRFIPAHLPRSTAIRQDALNAVSLLWGFAPHLPIGDRIPMPAWETHGVKHYLPVDTDRNENATPAIHPAVISPLLIWALRFVDFADDIIIAWQEHQRLLDRVREHPNPEATIPLRTFLDRCAAENNALPVFVDGSAGSALLKELLVVLNDVFGEDGLWPRVVCTSR